MNNKSTAPEQKGFFGKVLETIEDLWDGTKDKAEDLKAAAEDSIDHLKEKVSAKQPVLAKKAKTAKKAVKTKSTVVKATLEDAKVKSGVILAKATKMISSEGKPVVKKTTAKL